MLKKNLTYRLTVFIPGSQEEPVIVKYPITCKFNSQRGTFSNANKCTIDLYNVSPAKRSKIFKDALVGDLDEKNWKFVKLEAGWNGVLSQIFYGRILQAYSSKTGGQTDVITRIECIPFDIFNSQTGVTFAAGTSYKEAYKTMSGDLQNCEIGNTGTLEGSFKTQTTFNGNTMDCLNELSGGNTYVDNGVLNTLMANEVIDIPVPLVTDQNGLLATPIRRQATITIKMLFEPTLIVGQLLEIDSNIQPQYNGQYKVLGFTHDCTISPTEAGQRTTTVDLWAIPLLTSTDINITGERTTSGENAQNAYKVKGDSVTPINSNFKDTNWVSPVNKGYKITSYYGYRPAPKPGASTGHKGIDIGVPSGTAVKATKSGTVYLKSDPGGYGKYIEMDHGYINGKKVISRYGHLSKYIATNGQQVKQGQVIALSGNTGNSTGPHLHFEIRINGAPVNPLNYVKI